MINSERYFRPSQRTRRVQPVKSYTIQNQQLSTMVWTEHWKTHGGTKMKQRRGMSITDSPIFNCHQVAKNGPVPLSISPTSHQSEIN